MVIPDMIITDMAISVDMVIPDVAITDAVLPPHRSAPPHQV
jgi:hypothetical protein